MNLAEGHDETYGRSAVYVVGGRSRSGVAALGGREERPEMGVSIDQMVEGLAGIAHVDDPACAVRRDDPDQVASPRAVRGGIVARSRPSLARLGTSRPVVRQASKRAPSAQAVR